MAKVEIKKVNNYYKFHNIIFHLEKNLEELNGVLLIWDEDFEVYFNIERYSTLECHLKDLAMTTRSKNGNKKS